MKLRRFTDAGVAKTRVPLGGQGVERRGERDAGRLAVHAHRQIVTPLVTHFLFLARIFPRS